MRCYHNWWSNSNIISTQTIVCWIPRQTGTLMCDSKPTKWTPTYFDPNQILFSTLGWEARVPVGRWWPRGKRWSARDGRSRASRQPHRGPWAPEQVWGLTSSRIHLLTQCRSLKPGSPYDCVLFHCRSLAAGGQTKWGGWRAGWQNLDKHTYCTTFMCAHMHSGAHTEKYTLKSTYMWIKGIALVRHTNEVMEIGWEGTLICLRFHAVPDFK